MSSNNCISISSDEDDHPMALQDSKDKEHRKNNNINDPVAGPSTINCDPKTGTEMAGVKKRIAPIPVRNDQPLETEPEFYTMASDYNSKLFRRFVEACEPLIQTKSSSAAEAEKIIGKLWRVHENARSIYKNSPAFENLLRRQIALLENSYEKTPFLYIKYVMDELKDHKKSDKNNKSKDNLRIDNRETNLPSTSSNGQNLEADNNDEDESDSDSLSGLEPADKQKAKSYGKVLRKLNLSIKALEEKEVNFDKEKDSSFIRLDRFKKRFIQVYEKLCSIKKKSADAGRPILRKITFSGSGYPDVEKAVEKVYNKRKKFPDFSDILKITKEVKKSEHLRPESLHRIATVVFNDFGKLLKQRRQVDDYNVMISYLPNEPDPANEDEELQKKLNMNYEGYKHKEAEVMELFVQKAAGIEPDVVDSAASSEGENEEEEEEEDEEEEEEVEDDDKCNQAVDNLEEHEDDKCNQHVDNLEEEDDEILFLDDLEEELKSELTTDSQKMYSKRKRSEDDVGKRKREKVDDNEVGACSDSNPDKNCLLDTLLLKKVEAKHSEIIVESAAQVMDSSDSNPDKNCVTDRLFSKKAEANPTKMSLEPANDLKGKIEAVNVDSFPTSPEEDCLVIDEKDELSTIVNVEDESKNVSIRDVDLLVDKMLRDVDEMEKSQTKNFDDGAECLSKIENSGCSATSNGKLNGNDNISSEDNLKTMGNNDEVLNVVEENVDGQNPSMSSAIVDIADSYDKKADYDCKIDETDYEVNSGCSATNNGKLNSNDNVGSEDNLKTNNDEVLMGNNDEVLNVVEENVDGQNPSSSSAIIDIADSCDMKADSDCEIDETDYEVNSVQFICEKKKDNMNTSLMGNVKRKETIFNKHYLAQTVEKEKLNQKLDSISNSVVNNDSSNCSSFYGKYRKTERVKNSKSEQINPAVQKSLYKTVPHSTKSGDVEIVMYSSTAVGTETVEQYGSRKEGFHADSVEIKRSYMSNVNNNLSTPTLANKLFSNVGETYSQTNKSQSGLKITSAFSLSSKDNFMPTQKTKNGACKSMITNPNGCFNLSSRRNLLTNIQRNKSVTTNTRNSLVHRNHSLNNRSSINVKAGSSRPSEISRSSSFSQAKATSRFSVRRSSLSSVVRNVLPSRSMPSNNNRFARNIKNLSSRPSESNGNSRTQAEATSRFSTSQMLTSNRLTSTVTREFLKKNNSEDSDDIKIISIKNDKTRETSPDLCIIAEKPYKSTAKHKIMEVPLACSTPLKETSVSDSGRTNRQTARLLIDGGNTKYVSNGSAKKVLSQGKTKVFSRCVHGNKSRRDSAVSTVITLD